LTYALGAASPEDGAGGNRRLTGRMRVTILVVVIGVILVILIGWIFVTVIRDVSTDEGASK
jgi:hypothetical protein